MTRSLAFAGFSGACLIGAALYVGYAARRDTPLETFALPAVDDTVVTPIDGAPPPKPWVLFRRTSLNRQNGALTLAPLSDVAAARRVSGLLCDRVHMAAGKGVCLSADRGVITTYRALLFDERFTQAAELPLAGVPSRAQVAPDGKLAATTVFVTGHSYADGGFSTRTSIIDLETGAWLIEDLEGFTVRREGRIAQSPDFNFWGVTFTRDGRTFYATLGTRAETLLVKGDVDARSVEVVEENVECPSLSPDNRRVAFKQREGGLVGSVKWRLWVMDLQTRQRHALAETRSVDDQVQWLDDDRVLYAMPGEGQRVAVMDQWTVPADGSGSPEMFLAESYSAGVVRH